MSPKMRARLKLMDPKERATLERAQERTNFRMETLYTIYDCFMLRAGDDGKIKGTVFRDLGLESGITKPRVLRSFLRAWGFRDGEASSSITFDQFVDAFERATMTDKYGFIFDSFDLDGDGFIELDELELILWCHHSSGVSKKESDEAAEKQAKDDALVVFNILMNNLGTITRQDFLDAFDPTSSSSSGRRQSLDAIGVAINSDIFVEFGSKVLNVKQ